MEPISISIATSAILASVDWKSIGKQLLGDGVKDGAKTGGKTLLRWLKDDDREKAAKKAVELFVEAFLRELEDKIDLSAALPGFKTQLKNLIEYAAPDIVGWMQPETGDVDLGPVERMWGGLGLDSLGDFNWALVAQDFARAIRKLCKA